ncbi:MAG: hypothetical protein EAZ89_03480, partial [Bacteroidetes bacterium]
GSLALLAVGTLAMAFYRPKWLIYFALTFLVTRNMFVYYPYYIKFVYVGDGPGDLLLSFLRKATRESPAYGKFLWVTFVIILMRQLLLWIPKGRQALILDRRMTLIFIFIVCFVISTLANMVFSKASFETLIGLGLPLLLFYLVVTTPMDMKQLAMLASYLSFIGFEMQMLIMIVNNWPNIMAGHFFFGDYAFGTFMFPLSEFSGFMISTSYFMFFMRFLIDKRPSDLIRMLVCFYGFVSIAAMYFVFLNAIFTLVAIAIAYFLKVINVKQVAGAAIAMGIMLVPAYLIITDPTIFPQAEHVNNNLNKNANSDIKDIPKVYSFINLYNMMEAEGKFFFGAGPGMFLSANGDSPLTRKYGTAKVLNLRKILSSSQQIENSFVGIVGEIGIIGYLAYMGFYVNLLKGNLRHVTRRFRMGLPPDPLYASLLVSAILFFIISLLRNMIESINFGFPFMYWVVLVYLTQQKEQALWAKASEEAQSRSDPPEVAASPQLA